MIWYIRKKSNEKKNSFFLYLHLNIYTTYNCLIALDEFKVDWSGRRRLRREWHELKTPQASLLVEEAEAMPRGKRPSETEINCVL
jgi:hypothetical protein